MKQTGKQGSLREEYDLFDFAIIGGGIVGLSTGWMLSHRYPNASILILEKGEGWAQHQTGHNSGVIHSGIYYRPGSFKARFAREGGAKLIDFCKEYGIEYEICGKVMVATDPDELPLLENLYERGLQNGLSVEMISSDELREIEPHAQGLAAVKVPSTGIVDYKNVAETLAALVANSGGNLQLNSEVKYITDIGNSVKVVTDNGDFQTRMLINCAGLHSDRVAALCGVESDMKIIPFRGEYYELTPEKRYLVKNLIYPVPDPSFPFLGVHFTRAIDGSVEAGPNAVLALSREGYKKTDFRSRDVAEILAYPAFWKLAASYWRTGVSEIVRSFSKKAFVNGLKKLVPTVEDNDLVPASAGVRAQALMKNGKLMDDFIIVDGENSVHVLNAPSPAATAAFPIAEAIVDRVISRNHR